MDIKYLYDKNGELIAEIKYTQEVFEKFEKHTHSIFGIGLICEGEVVMQYDKICSAKKDEIIIFNPNVVHCTKNRDAKGYYVVFFYPKWCKKLQHEIFDRCDEFLPVGENIVKDSVLYTKLIDIFHSCMNEEEFEYEQALEQGIKELFENYCNIEDQNSSHDEKLIVKNMQNYILENLEYSLSIDEIAKELGYNKSYLIRVFKKQIGLTPQSFIRNQRVNKAKSLIINSQVTNFSQLAQNVGFFDQSHLNRSFKKVYGKNPKFYKKD